MMEVAPQEKWPLSLERSFLAPPKMTLRSPSRIRAATTARAMKSSTAQAVDWEPSALLSLPGQEIRDPTQLIHQLMPSVAWAAPALT